MKTKNQNEPTAFHIAVFNATSMAAFYILKTRKNYPILSFFLEPLFFLIRIILYPLIKLIR